VTKFRLARWTGVVALVSVLAFAASGPLTASGGPLPSADLEVSMSAPPSVVAGDQFQYSIMVMDNNGAASDFNLHVTLPAGISFSDVASPASAMCQSASDGFTCNGNLDPNSNPSVTYVVDAQLASSAADGSSLQATSNVSATTTSDPDTSNNSADATVGVTTQADLQSSISAPSGNQIAGDPNGFDYTVGVTNNGPSDNTGGYTVTGTLPTGITFNTSSTSGSPACQTATGGFTCTGGNLASGASDSYTVPVLVDPSVPASTPNAQVTVASKGTTDPTPGDDTSSAGVTIVTGANFNVSLSPAPSNVFANTDPTKNTVTYTLTVQNNGYSDAQNVVLKDALPTGLINGMACQVVNTGDCSSSADFGSYTGSFSLGTLAAGASAQVLITAQADPSLRPSSPPSAQVFSDSANVTSDTQSLDLIDPGTNVAPDSRSAGPVTTTYDTVPGQAQNVTVAAGNAATSIAGIVTWSAPALDGGHIAGAAPVTQYLVTVNKVGAPSTSATQYTVLATASQVTCPEKSAAACYTLNLPGQGLAHALTNGTAYTVTVQAQNIVGSSDAVGQNVTPTLDATAALVGTTGQTLTTCTTATVAHPTCVQYTIPSGTGGVFGVQGNIGLPAGFCSGSNCAAGTGALSLGALNGFTDRTHPISEIITWDASTINLALYDPKGTKICANNSTAINCYPNDVPVFYETAANLALGQPATELNLHFCATSIKLGGAGNVNYARPTPYTDSAGSACIKKINILGSKSNPGANGDIQVQLNVTSDSDALAGHH
jgi:uncharacterized repeat protein (TIGR01451 family)